MVKLKETSSNLDTSHSIFFRYIDYSLHMGQHEILMKGAS